MPIPISRPSLTTSLEQRYATQTEGGAYNAKNAGASTLTSVTPQETKFDTNPKFVVNQKFGQSNFKGVSGQSYTEISALMKGFNNTPYN